jgi:ADP-heptose:LPS heptosyltransferase
MAKRPNGGHWLDLWLKAFPTRWDLVVDIRGSAIAWLIPAVERRVYSRRRDEALHKVEAASLLIFAEAMLEPELFLDEKARADAAAVIGEDPRPILAVAPVAAVANKSWPADRWAELARALLAGPLAGWRIMAMGGPGDAEAAAPLLAAAGAADVDTVGKLDILAAGAALERAALFVGNDSGLMHLSAASGTPTLGLFGPTDWRRYGPWGSRARVLTAGAQGEAAAIEGLSMAAVAEGVAALKRDFTAL